jgi:peptidoglycan-associated lipoprotein
MTIFSADMRERLLNARAGVIALAFLVSCVARPISGSETGSTAAVDEVTTDGSDNDCDPTPEDATAPCGLAQVYFAATEFTLDERARCQITAAAPCFAASEQVFILEAHASADEVNGGEEAIFLTDRRGQGVKVFLAEFGVPPSRLVVISKGSLEASTPSSAADQRVRFIEPH